MLICLALLVSDFQILTKSCFIELKNDPSPKSEMVHGTRFSLNISYSTDVWLTQLNKDLTSKPVMVSCEFNSNWRQFYFLLNPSKTPRCQFCTEMSDLFYVRKPRLNVRFVLCAKTSINCFTVLIPTFDLLQGNIICWVLR